MKLGHYKIKAANNLTTFKFINEGSKGRIPKLVQYSQSDEKNLFNLAFGDKNLETGELDDFAGSNNGDCAKMNGIHLKREKRRKHL